MSKGTGLKIILGVVAVGLLGTGVYLFIKSLNTGNETEDGNNLPPADRGGDRPPVDNSGGYKPPVLNNTPPVVTNKPVLNYNVILKKNSPYHNEVGALQDMMGMSVGTARGTFGPQTESTLIAKTKGKFGNPISAGTNAIDLNTYRKYVLGLGFVAGTVTDPGDWVNILKNKF